mmetsp:Transcript_58872/g.153132  ORF Transcript_58872/g.153132 Transcript_58872/m.153132 type:complete len:222 (+) Transcript_58872:435-1100(+)
MPHAPLDVVSAIWRTRNQDIVRRQLPGSQYCVEVLVPVVNLRESQGRQVPGHRPVAIVRVPKPELTRLRAVDGLLKLQQQRLQVAIGPYVGLAMVIWIRLISVGPILGDEGVLLHRHRRIQRQPKFALAPSSSTSCTEAAMHTNGSVGFLGLAQSSFARPLLGRHSLRVFDVALVAASRRTSVSSGSTKRREPCPLRLTQGSLTRSFFGPWRLPHLGRRKV